MTLKIHKVSDFKDLQFSEKMQKFICKLPKRFANCELRTANSNPALIFKKLADMPLPNCKIHRKML